MPSGNKQLPESSLTYWLTYHPREQGSWGQHGAHLGPVGPRWAPCGPHEPCYQWCLLYLSCMPFISPQLMGCEWPVIQHQLLITQHRGNHQEGTLYYWPFVWRIYQYGGFISWRAVMFSLLCTWAMTRLNISQAWWQVNLPVGQVDSG